MRLCGFTHTPIGYFPLSLRGDTPPWPCGGQKHPIWIEFVLNRGKFGRPTHWTRAEWSEMEVGTNSWPKGALLSGKLRSTEDACTPRVCVRGMPNWHMNWKFFARIWDRFRKKESLSCYDLYNDEAVSIGAINWVNKAEFKIGKVYKKAVWVKCHC